jgi:hypothetical protein
MLVEDIKILPEAGNYESQVELPQYLFAPCATRIRAGEEQSSTACRHKSCSSPSSVSSLILPCRS